MSNIYTRFRLLKRSLFHVFIYSFLLLLNHKICLQDTISFPEVWSQGVGMSPWESVEIVSIILICCLSECIPCSLFLLYILVQQNQSPKAIQRPEMKSSDSTFHPWPRRQPWVYIPWKPSGGICVRSKRAVISRLCHWKRRLTSVLSINCIFVIFIPVIHAVVGWRGFIFFPFLQNQRPGSG